MTLIEAINKIDEFKPNGYTQLDKIGWLSILDGMVWLNVVNKHELNEGEEASEMPKYDEDTSLDTELLVPAPFEDMYLYWLESKIDYSNGEYAKYNNSIIRFNDTFSQFRNAYNSSHMPKTENIKYF